MRRFVTGEHGVAEFTSLVLQDTYTLGPCLGRGGMGEVYEATHARLPGRMAVKILRPHLRTNQDAFARFCREAQTLSAVRHPHIIKIFDFNTSPALFGLPYFVMEYLDGVDLERRLAESGPVSVAATIRIVDAVASALGAAHAAGVVHRDLKPANIFLVRGEGQEADFVKVIDFEQALGLVHEVDARADQFALAAITHAMLTGRELFVGDNAASLLYQVVHKRHPPLSRFVSWDTTSIQPVLDRALAERPQDRFEGVVEFAQALSAAAEARRVGPATPFGDADLSRGIDRVPRGPRRAVALGLAVLGLAAVVGYKGWYDGVGGRAVNAEHKPAVKVQPRPRIVEEVPPPAPPPAPVELAAVGERSTPHRPVAPRVSRRQLLLHRRSPARSEWQSIQIVSLPPSAAASDEPSAGATIDP